MGKRRFEIRKDDKGKFDELVVYDGRGNCIVHLEMMSDQHLWGSVELGNRKRVMFNVTSKRNLTITAEED